MYLCVYVYRYSQFYLLCVPNSYSVDPSNHEPFKKHDIHAAQSSIKITLYPTSLEKLTPSMTAFYLPSNISEKLKFLIKHFRPNITPTSKNLSAKKNHAKKECIYKANKIVILILLFKAIIVIRIFYSKQIILTKMSQKQSILVIHLHQAAPKYVRPKNYYQKHIPLGMTINSIFLVRLKNRSTGLHVTWETRETINFGPRTELRHRIIRVRDTKYG